MIISPKRTVALIAATVLLGAVSFAYLCRNPLKIILSREAIPVKIIFEYNSDIPSTAETLRGASFNGLAIDQTAKINLFAEKNGMISFVIPAQKPTFTVLHIVAWTEGNASQCLSLENMRTKKVTVLSTNPRMLQRKFDLSSSLTDFDDHKIVFQTTGDSGRSIVHMFSVKQVPAAPYFPPLHTFLIGMICVILVMQTIDMNNSPATRPWLIAGIMLLLVLVSCANGNTVMGNPYLWEIGLILVLFYRSRDERTAGRHYVWAHEWALIPMTLGFALRWNFLPGTVDLFLGGGDATMYRNLAIAFDWHHPFATSYREPFFIWLQYGVLKLLGPAEIHFRFSTLLLSTAAIPAAYALAFLLSNKRSVAFLAALMIACSNLLIFRSVQGDRNDLYTLFVTLFCAAAVLFKNKQWQEEAILGLLAGITALTWLVGLAGTFLVYGWRLVTAKSAKRHGPVFLLFVITALAPHFFYQWKVNHDPLYSINFTTSYYREAKTQSSSDKMSVNNKWIDFLWHEEGLKKIIVDVIHGYANLFFNPTFRYNKVFLGFHYTNICSYILFPFFLLGILLELKNGNLMPFVLIFSFLNIMVAFLEEAPHERLFQHAAIFFAYFWAVGTAAAVCTIKENLHNKEHN